jgi:hydrogenase maturation protease
MRCVAQRLEGSRVHLVDYGIRGMHLAYDLLDDWDALVLIDVLPNQGSPGKLHIFEADHETLTTTAGFDAHCMDPTAVFATLATLGGTPPHTVVVGCEAQSVDEGMGLTAPLAAAVPGAARAVEDLVTSLLAAGAKTSVGEG